MRFEWDEAKNEENIRKRGIDFADVVDIFNHPMLTWEDDREAYGRCDPYYLCAKSHKT